MIAAIVFGLIALLFVRTEGDDLLTAVSKCFLFGFLLPVFILVLLFAEPDDSPEEVRRGVIASCRSMDADVTPARFKECVEDHDAYLDKYVDSSRD